MKVKTHGVHHVGLTVPDINSTRDFFTIALGLEQVGEKPDYPAYFVSDGKVMLSLWQAKDPATAIAFNRHNNIGLPHLALKVQSSDELEQLYGQLKKRDDVDIEFSPEALGSGEFSSYDMRYPRKYPFGIHCRERVI